MNDYSNFIGKVLDKRYKILELVGVGGMACVLRAQDLVMNRTVAIKILNDEYNGNEQAEHRFIDESKAVAMLSHKNIVSIYDVAIYPDIKYIVMEYLDGITLREYLDNKGALPWKEACIYILQVLRALEHAHSKGVIHRDIKPQNIILQKNGEIKVMDFGIAKIPTSAAVSGDKAVGTVYYISPEQASGKETDACSDLYSVGILLYEAVTGTLPFKASSPMAVAAMQVNDEPPNPRDLVLSIPVGVSQIILKAMMKDPAERFRSAHSMGKAIEWVLRNPDVIFSLSNEQPSAIGDTSVISIDMIDTAEIKPYDENEIAQSLGTKTISEREREQKKKEEKEQQKKKRAAKKKKRKRKQHSGTLFPVIAGIFFPFILVALVVGLLLGVTFLKGTFFTSDDTPRAKFPNLVGQVYNQELIAKLQNGAYGQTFVIDEGAVTYSNNPNFANGEIISTVPAANAVKLATNLQGQPVFHFTSIVVNRVETITAMPNLVGYSSSEARVLLLNGGVDANCILREDETDPDLNILFDDQVTRTVPAAGDPYTPGTTIVLYLCRRSESVQTDVMPNCLGMTEEEAVKQCSYALYNVIIEDVPMAGGNGTVIGQSIDPGTISASHTQVKLRVSRKASEMPNLLEVSLPQAKAMLDELGVSYQVTVYENIIEGDTAVIGFTDLQQLLTRLELIGGVVAVNPVITENTAVLFQSVLPGQPLPSPSDPPIILIAVNYAQLF